MSLWADPVEQDACQSKHHIAPKNNEDCWAGTPQLQAVRKKLNQIDFHLRAAKQHLIVMGTTDHINATASRMTARESCAESLEELGGLWKKWALEVQKTHANGCGHIPDNPKLKMMETRVDILMVAAKRVFIEIPSVAAALLEAKNKYDFELKFRDLRVEHAKTRRPALMNYDSSPRLY